MSNFTTADTPLTVKQTKFAAEVANGTPKARARRKFYKSSPPEYVQSDSRKASELAKRPNVAAEIRRLTWLSMPNLDDAAGMRGQAVRIISDISRDPSAPHAVRLNAAMALYKIAETTRQAAHPAATTSEQDRLLDSLRKLYASIQGLPAPDLPLVAPVAGACSGEGDAIDIQTFESESTPQEPAEMETAESETTPE